VLIIIIKALLNSRIYGIYIMRQT